MTSKLRATRGHNWWQRFLPNYAYLIVVAFFWIVLNPFREVGLDAAPVARALAFVAEFTYPDKSEGAITVLTMADSAPFLREHSWPLPTDRWRLLLEEAACSGPKAIFVDVILYKTEQEDDGWPQLAQSINDIEAGRFICAPGKRAPATPIFFARGSAGDQLGSSRIGESSLVVTGWPAESGYPLSSQAGPSSQAQLTAAYAIARTLCADGSKIPTCPASLPPQSDDSMDVVWGTSKSGQTAELTDGGETDCQSHPGLVAISDIFRSIMTRSAPRFQPCTYHAHITIEQYNDANRLCMQQNSDACQLLANTISNKILMIGVDRSSVQDKVYSPINGELQGVFYHAMALDNLLTLGKHYYKTSLDARIGIWALVIVFLALPCAVGATRKNYRDRIGVRCAVIAMAIFLPLIVFTASIKLSLVSPVGSAILLGLFFVFIDAARVEFSLRELLIGAEPMDEPEESNARALQKGSRRKRSASPTK